MMIHHYKSHVGNGGFAPATPGFNAVAPEWLFVYGATEAAPAIPAAESTLGSHPCVALSSAQVLPEWINRNLAGNAFAANGDNLLNFVSRARGSLQRLLESTASESNSTPYGSAYEAIKSLLSEPPKPGPGGKFRYPSLSTSGGFSIIANPLVYAAIGGSCKISIQGACGQEAMAWSCAMVPRLPPP
jgi:hypothetical protein